MGKKIKRPWHNDGMEGLTDTHCYLHVVIKLENTSKRLRFFFYLLDQIIEILFL